VMTEFDEHTHGMQIMYSDNDPATFVAICPHVDHIRAIGLLCAAIHAVAQRDGVDSHMLLKGITAMMPDFEKLVKRNRH
jgi:hypothetical protein